MVLALEDLKMFKQNHPRQDWLDCLAGLSGRDQLTGKGQVDWEGPMTGRDQLTGRDHLNGGGPVDWEWTS